VDEALYIIQEKKSGNFCKVGVVPLAMNCVELQSVTVVYTICLVYLCREK